jgi:hypothetical protein
MAPRRADYNLRHLLNSNRAYQASLSRKAILAAFLFLLRNATYRSIFTAHRRYFIGAVRFFMLIDSALVLLLYLLLTLSHSVMFFVAPATWQETEPPVKKAVWLHRCSIGCCAAKQM